MERQPRWYDNELIAIGSFIAGLALSALFAKLLAEHTSLPPLLGLVGFLPWALCAFFVFLDEVDPGRHKRKEEGRLRRQGEDRQRRQEEEYRRLQPERDRALWESEERLRRQADAQRRRDEARASCERAFALHAPDLGGRFTREQFDRYAERYLTDGEQPEVVEERGRQLIDLLRAHLEKVEQPQKRKSLAELAAWFLEEKRQIEATALGAEDKEVLLAQLEERYVKLQEKYLRSVQP